LDRLRSNVKQFQSSLGELDLGIAAQTKLIDSLGEFMKQEVVMKEVYTESIVEHNKCQIEKFSAADKSVKMAILALNSTSGG
jgi:hypothetical protein